MTLNKGDSGPKHPLFGTIETLPDGSIDHQAAAITNAEHTEMVQKAIADALAAQTAREAK